MTIKVFLADDHRVMRDGLRMLLESRSDMEVVGDAADGRRCVSLVKKLQPDVVIMDIAMPELNGIEATRKVCSSCPGTRVVILSMYTDHEDIFRALDAGAKGYVVKEAAGKEVIDAVKAVHNGHLFISSRIVKTALDEYLELKRARKPMNAIDRLSPREREILQFVVEGYSSAEIAQRIYLSPKTVETYRSRLMKKLDIGDIPRLVRYAMKHRLIFPE